MHVFLLYSIPVMFRGNSSLTPKLQIGSRLIDRRSIVLSIIGLLFVFSLGIAVRNTYAESENISRTGKHVLTVYDDGVQKGILTEATTLRDALKQADITIGKNDVTEPALDDTLVAASYDVNIYRARPVSVHDGKTVKKVMSPYRSALRVAKQAGVKLHDEDTVKLESSDDVVSDGAVERLTIERATPFTFVFYGEPRTDYTQASTVGEMLAEKGVEVGDKDKISPSLSTPIAAGMKIDLWREGKQTVTRKETIKHAVRQIQDADQPIGYKKVKTAGLDGQKLVTYELTSKERQRE